MLFGLRLDVGAGFAERVAKGGLLVDAAAQIVEQHADLAEVFGIGHQQMDARPVEVGLGRRRADGDADAADVEGGEELDEAVLEGGRHLRGIGFEKRRVSSRIDGGGDGALFLEHDVVAVAAFGDGGGRGPARWRF